MPTAYLYVREISSADTQKPATLYCCKSTFSLRGMSFYIHIDEYEEGNPHNEWRQDIDFCHKRFKFVRRSLQFFGFWHKPNAGLLCKYIYPLLVNLVILGIFIMECSFFVLACSLLGNGATHELILELFVRVTMSCSYWLMHSLTIRFFKSRDMEDNMFNVELGKEGMALFESFTRKLNIMFVVCHSLAILVTGVSIKTGILDHFPTTWSSQNATAISELDAVIYRSNFIGEPTNLFWIPVSLTLTWIMFILYESSKFRLSKLTEDFLHWEESPEDAVYHHISHYSLRINKSCSKVAALFFTHNILMIILIPQFMYLCVLVGRKKSAGEFIAFTVYFLVIFSTWIVPLMFAEGIRSNELAFANEINKFCRKYIAEKSGVTLAEITKKTFEKRKNVEKLLIYLKERKTGFIMWGFALQLKISAWSFYVGLLLFVFRVVNG